jgi:hypothetical protein
MDDLVAQYTPKEMVRMMTQVPLPTNFLSAMLINERNITNKTIIEIDKVLGNQVVAGYVNRQGGPNVVGKAGYDTLLHVAPYIYEQLPYKPSDVDVRGADSTVYDNPAAYLATRVEAWLTDLENRFIRAEERQLAEALQTGKVEVDGKDVKYTIDFQQKATHLIDISVSAPWTGAADKLAQIEGWCQQIDDTGAPGAGIMIGDSKSMNLLINDTAILALLDNKRVERGEINFELLREQRATFLGTLRGIGMNIDLYSYQGMYQTVNGATLTTHRYMNDNTIILTSRQMDTRFHYAKIENFKTGDFMGQRFPNRWESEDGKNRYITMESSPLVGLHQPDAVISVIVAP